MEALRIRVSLECDVTLVSYNYNYLVRNEGDIRRFFGW